MIDRVGGSTYQSLQGLQATRHFQEASRKSGSVFRQALAHELEISTPVSEGQKSLEAHSTYPSSYKETAPIPPVRRQPLPIQRPTSDEAALQALIQDVRQIAEASGFIGVSAQDVIRAYHTGQSFLADYTV